MLWQKGTSNEYQLLASDGVTANFSPSTVNLTKDETSGLNSYAHRPPPFARYGANVSSTVKAAEGSQDFATANGTLTIQSARDVFDTTVTCPSSVNL